MAKKKKKLSIKEKIEDKFAKNKQDIEVFQGGKPINLNRTIDGEKLRDKLAKDIGDILDQEVENQKPLIDKISTWNKQYRGIKRPKSWPFEGAANSAIPMTRWLIDTIIVRVLDVIFGQKKLFVVKAKRPEWQEIEKDIEDYIDWWSKSVAKLKKNFYSAILQSCKVGTGPGKLEYVRKKRTEYSYYDRSNPAHKGLKRYKDDNGNEIVKYACTAYEGAMYKGISREDFIISADSSCMEDAYLMGFRRYYRPPQFESKVKSGLYNISKDEMERIKNGEPIDDTKIERIRDSGKKYDENIVDKVEVWELWFQYDVDGDGEEDDIVMVFHRDSRTILRAYYNPYFYKFRPFHAFIGRPVEYMFDGESDCEILAPTQEELDTIHNQRLDRMTQINAPVYLRKIGSFQKKGDNKVYPGAIFDVDDPETALKEVAGHDVYPSTDTAEALALQYGMKTMGVSDAVMGQSTAERPVARETLALIQENNKVFKFRIDNYRDTITEIGLQAIEMAAQYSPKYTYTVVKGGKRIEKEINFPFGSVRDGIELELMASSEVLNTEVRREINLTVYQLLKDYFTGAVGIAQQLINPQMPPGYKKFLVSVTEVSAKLMNRILYDFGIVDADALVATVGDSWTPQDVVQPQPPPPGAPPPQGAPQGPMPGSPARM